MTKQLYLGIDPGANGGLAAIDSNKKVYALQRMPSFPEEVLAWFRMFSGVGLHVVLEEVSGYQGVEHPGSRMFEFGKWYGYVEMGILSVQCLDRTKFIRCPPKQWQKMLGLRKKEKDETDTSWKNYLKDEASKLFPRIKVTLKTADALLLAYYCHSIFSRG